MLHLVSTSAGTSGIFVGASQGQGFVIPHDQSDYRAPTRLFWVPALLLVPVILLICVVMAVGPLVAGSMPGDTPFTWGPRTSTGGFGSVVLS